MTDRRWWWAGGAVALVLAGCSESSAGGVGEGIGKAILLLLFVGLVLPAIVVGSIVALVVSARRRRK